MIDSSANRSYFREFALKWNYGGILGWIDEKPRRDCMSIANCFRFMFYRAAFIIKAGDGLLSMNNADELSSTR